MLVYTDIINDNYSNIGCGKIEHIEYVYRGLSPISNIQKRITKHEIMFFSSKTS